MSRIDIVKVQVGHIRVDTTAHTQRLVCNAKAFTETHLYAQLMGLIRNRDKLELSGMSSDHSSRFSCPKVSSMKSLYRLSRVSRYSTNNVIVINENDRTSWIMKKLAENASSMWRKNRWSVWSNFHLYFVKVRYKNSFWHFLDFLANL